MGQLVFQAALGGQVALSGPNTASSFTVAVPAVTGTMVTTGDTGTVTSTMISGPLTSAVGGTGVNNGSATLTLAGNVSHTGAFTQTIAATANTSVTLPTSGTLISSTTALSGAVTGTPSSTTYLRGDGTWATVSVSPGGSTTQVQYNNAGAFGGSANFTFNGTTVTMANDASINGLTVGRGASAVVGNNALGTSALAANTTGYDNTAVGYSAMLSNQGGIRNTALGSYALQANTSGSSNVAVGRETLQANTTASANTAVGFQAGYSITTGAGVVAIGANAGTTIATGNYGTYIGYQSTASSSSVNNEMLICSGGSTTAKGSNTGFISPNGGGVYQGNNSATWSIASDQRLKKNIVDNTVGLSAINAIQIRNFEYRLPEEVTELPQNQAIAKEGVQLGVIAQELQAILPDCVKEESTGVLSVNSENITWHLINAVKELSAKVTALENKGA